MKYNRSNNFKRNKRRGPRRNIQKSHNGIKISLRHDTHDEIPKQRRSNSNRGENLRPNDLRNDLNKSQCINVNMVPNQDVVKELHLINDAIAGLERYIKYRYSLDPNLFQYLKFSLNQLYVDKEIMSNLDTKNQA